MAKLDPRYGCVLLSMHNNIVYVLMIYSNYNKQWEFPRGGIDKENDKTPFDTIQREVLEETGIDITPYKHTLRKIYTDEEWHMTRYGVKLHYDVVYYTCFVPKLIQPKPKDRQEVQQANWFPLDKAVLILLQQKTLMLLNALVKSLLYALRAGFVNINI